MRKPKPRLKDYADQAIVILEKQKDNKIFTRYAKAVLSERYLSEDMSIERLGKKALKSRSDFEKEIIWDALTTKLLVTEEEKVSIMELHLIEILPIDYIVKLTQNAISPQMKSHAQKVCYEKQLRLEEELGLGFIDHQKYEQDNIEEEKKEITGREKPRISKSEQFNRSISTKKFLQNFYGITCQEERVTHEVMERILNEKGFSTPTRGGIQSITIDKVATGEWILVRDGNRRRNARIIPYMNPRGMLLEKLSRDLGIPYQKIRYNIKER